MVLKRQTESSEERIYLVFRGGEGRQEYLKGKVFKFFLLNVQTIFPRVYVPFIVRTVKLTIRIIKKMFTTSGKFINKYTLKSYKKRSFDKFIQK